VEGAARLINVLAAIVSVFVVLVTGALLKVALLPFRLVRGLLRRRPAPI
jgi:hypothetical protein